jgi:hypothetical protein
MEGIGEDVGSVQGSHPPSRVQNACRDGRTNADCGDSGLMMCPREVKGRQAPYSKLSQLARPTCSVACAAPNPARGQAPNVQRVRQGRGSIVACPATLAGAWQAKNAKELLFRVSARSKVLPCRRRTKYNTPYCPFLHTPSSFLRRCNH